MKGQKQAVVELVHKHLPGFVPGKDIALVMLSQTALESLKAYIATMIVNSEIEYSKDRTKHAEVVTYARSMVMNHLKKAKELNGNQVYGVGPAVVQSKPKAINLNRDLLSEDLKAIVDALV